MTAPERDYWMTAQEVADEQRIAVGTLYSWRAKSLKSGTHEGPRSAKRGKRLVYRRSDVNAWVAEQDSLTAVGGVQVAS